MKINDFKQTEQLKLIEAKFLRGRKLLDSMCEGLDAEQRRVVEGVYATAIPLMKETVVAEATMTADQISQLFGNAEKGATDSGSNRTALGKGKDVISAANKMIDDAGRWLQDTAPVKAFDAKFEEAKQAVKVKLGNSAGGQKILQSVESLGNYAKENPAKTAFVIGVLTAIASVAGGPVGGAIAGQVLRGSLELVKGEKLSTAIGKGIKTAALGYLSGKAFEMLGDWFADVRANIIDEKSFTRVTFDVSKTTQIGGGNNYIRWTDQLKDVNLKLLPDDADTINMLVGQIGKGGSAGVQAFDKLARLAAEFKQPDYTDFLKGLGETYRDNDSLLNWIQNGRDVMQAVSQGAIAGAGAAASGKGAGNAEANANVDDGEGTSYVRSNTESIEMSEAQIRQVFVGVSYLTESRLDELDFGAIKAQAAKIAQAGMAKAQEVGKNMTTRVTTSKLNKAWEKAGKPTDSADIMKILQDNGVAAEVATQAFKDTGVEAPPPVEKANVNVKALFDFIKTLPEKEMGEIKQLVTARQQEVATA